MSALKGKIILVKLIPWAIRISVIYLLVWCYGTYSLFSPYFPDEPYPWREYARVMLIIFLFHLPVLASTFSKARKYKWILIIPILGMIGLYTLMANQNSDFSCMLGICIHLLAGYNLFNRNPIMEGAQYEVSKSV